MATKSLTVEEVLKEKKTHDLDSVKELNLGHRALTVVSFVSANYVPKIETKTLIVKLVHPGVLFEQVQKLGEARPPFQQSH